MKNKAACISNYVIQKINTTVTADKTDRTVLARLRHGIGKEPGQDPQLWGEFLQNIPEALISTTKDPSRAEWAIYIALTIFAMHQQGKNHIMHVADISLGTAVGKLVNYGNDDMETRKSRIIRRFNPIATSQDIYELAHYIRCIVKLLKDSDIAMDYGNLAKDIYYYQNRESRDRICLQWGRDFYRELSANDKEENKNGEE